jgi:hypothetical protein
MKIPEGFEDCLSEHKACIVDSLSNQTVGWGFELTEKIGEERFEALKQFGELTCRFPQWYLITRWLTREEAVEQFGAVTNVTYGPRNGFKSVTYGDTMFKTKQLEPPREEQPKLGLEDPFL